MCAVSTANGEPYCSISSLRIVPEPKHDTYSAVALVKRQHRPDAVRGVPHRRQARPVVRPAVHVLLMAGLEELDLAQLALVVELLDEEELAGVDHGFHHHVLQAGPLGTSSTIFLQSSMLVAIGTVQATCLPALSAAIDIQA